MENKKRIYQLIVKMIQNEDEAAFHGSIGDYKKSRYYDHLTFNAKVKLFRLKAELDVLYPDHTVEFTDYIFQDKETKMRNYGCLSIAIDKMLK